MDVRILYIGAMVLALVFSGCISSPPNDDQPRDLGEDQSTNDSGSKFDNDRDGGTDSGTDATFVPDMPDDLVQMCSEDSDCTSNNPQPCVNNKVTLRTGTCDPINMVCELQRAECQSGESCWAERCTTCCTTVSLTPIGEGTYLTTINPNPPSLVDLLAEGICPGRQIDIVTIGDWGVQGGIRSSQAWAVFSTTSELQSPTNGNRIVGAIQTNLSSILHPGEEDIPQDFAINANSTTIAVPGDARFLFVAAATQSFNGFDPIGFRIQLSCATQ